MNFLEIQDLVGDNLLDLPAETEALIGTWVNRAIREAEDKHNYRHMEATGTYGTTEDTRLLTAKPSNWKETRADPWLLHDDGGTEEFDWAPAESDMLRLYSNSTTLSRGSPQFLLETDEELHVYPYPDGESDFAGGEYVIKVPYWAYTAALVVDADTNWWTDNYPLYLVHRASFYGFLHNRERPRAEEQAAVAGGILDEAKRVSKRSKMPRRMNLTIGGGVFAPGVRPRSRYRSGG